ncbi:MAG TPA: 4Fe-4S binding protein [Verrucomicrobiae bacterium]|nr:4Fe-4S binding protein [Verrucomicrobiae bacterium]
MPPKLLKGLRVVAAAAMLAALTAAFVDFRSLIPSSVGQRLAETQFIPSLVTLLTGASLSLACVIIATVTLAVGRVYCSAICPLGILQDVVVRLTKWAKGKSRPAPYSHPHTWLRQAFLWATILAAAAGFGGFALSLLDPYSNYGRIASDIFRPLVTQANNVLVAPAEAIGWHGLFRVPPAWFGFGVLAVPASVLVLIIALAAWRGRLYCNTVCPVGTLLGWLAQRAAFRLQIDRSACRKCAACLRACKAQCIDLRAGSIDFSRCVGCYNCMAACDQHGINYHFAWAQKTPQAASASRAGLEAVADPQRRLFLSQAVLGIAGAAGLSRILRAGDKMPAVDAREVKNFSPVICPPGSAGVERFLDRCTACHLCISECPTGVLQPALGEYGFSGIMKPRLDYRLAFCNFDCRRCSEVCPDGAIDLLDPATKHLAKIGEAHFSKDKCVVVTNGTDCAACSEHCPTKAVSMVPYGRNLRLPSVDNDFCIGCGACEYACPAKPDKAIEVTGLRVHGIAKKLIEPKATLPKSASDFPF